MIDIIFRFFSTFFTSKRIEKLNKKTLEHQRITLWIPLPDWWYLSCFFHILNTKHICLKILKKIFLPKKVKEIWTKKISFVFPLKEVVFYFLKMAFMGHKCQNFFLYFWGFSSPFREKTKSPMKKMSGARNAQNYPKHSFFVLRSW